MYSHRLKLIKYSIGAGLLLQLTACSLFPSSPESINSLVEQERYDDAIKAYERLKDDDKEQVNLSDIEKSRSRYEAESIKSIRQLSQQEQFRDANALLRQSHKNIPSSELLNQQALTSQALEASYFAAEKLQYKIALAEFYLQEAPTLEKLYQVEMNNSYYLRLVSSRPQQRANLAEELGEAGLDALERKQKIRAEQLLKLADALKEDQRWQQALGKIESAQLKKQAVATKKAEKKQQSRFQVLSAEFDSAYAKKDWLKSQKVLAEIKQLKLSNDDNKWYKKNSSALNTEVKTVVDKGIDRGQMLYSKGRIDEALEVWKESRKLSPDNEKLNENIQRAEKFQRKFKQLQNQ